MKKLALGIDLGGTKIQGIIMDDSGYIYHSHATPTGDSISNLLKVIKDLINFGKENNLYPSVIGLGSAGLVDHQQGIARESANIKFLKNYPLKNLIEKEFGINTFIDNDVKAGAIAEKFFGEGLDINDFIYITMGTGIGGAIFIDGKMYRGHDNHSGEIGHITLDPNGFECGCGKKGCYESIASGKAILRFVLEKIEQDYSTILTDLVQGNLNEIDTYLIAEAARKGDKLSLEAFKISAYHTGLVTSYLINIFNPDKIIISGGLSEAWDLLYPDIFSVSKKFSLSIPFNSVQIVKSTLGSCGVALGAAKLGFLGKEGLKI